MKIINLIYPAQSAGADVTSVAMDLGDLQTFSIAVDFTGSDLAGTLTLQSSNDNSDFVTVSGSSQAITNSGSHMWSVQGAGYRYVRVFWDYTSGTGNITAKLVAKENVQKGG